MLVGLEYFNEWILSCHQFCEFHLRPELRRLDEKKTVWFQKSQAMLHCLDRVGEVFQHVHQNYCIETGEGNFQGLDRANQNGHVKCFSAEVDDPWAHFHSTGVVTDLPQQGDKTAMCATEF